MEAEKNELFASCQKLKDDIGRLTIRAAENELLRAQIKLLTDRSTLQIAEFERQCRQDEQAIEALRAQTQARNEDHQAEMRELEEKAEQQRQTHEHQMAMMTAEQNQQRDAHTTQIDMLKKTASQQEAIVQQQVLAWKIQCMEAIKQQNNNGARNDKTDKSDNGINDL